MASIGSTGHLVLLQLLLVASLFVGSSLAGRKLTALYQQPGTLMKYHNGTLLCGKFAINLIWYGEFAPTQRAIVSDFVTSLSSPPKSQIEPSVATWWQTTETYYQLAKDAKCKGPASPFLGTQTLDDRYSLGKSLSMKQIVQLAGSKGYERNAVNVVLTASDVTVDGFCESTCGTHGQAHANLFRGKHPKFPYIWVGNSETQCPGQCAWPFHQPFYGPQTAPLIAPNNDVGMDGTIINLSGLLASTATNPSRNGFFQGSATAPLEAASACSGIYGAGAYPGYPGKLMVNPTTGASYNAHGAYGKEYLLPTLFNPATSSCST